MGTYRDKIGWALLKALKSLPANVPMADGIIRRRERVEKVMLGLHVMANERGWLDGAQGTPFSTRQIAQKVGADKNTVKACLRLAVQGRLDGQGRRPRIHASREPPLECPATLGNGRG